MKKKIYSILSLLMVASYTFSQTPQGIKQVDKEQVNFWDSPSTMIIAAILIVALIVSRKWSNKILKKRDEVVDHSEV